MKLNETIKVMKKMMLIIGLFGLLAFSAIAQPKLVVLEFGNKADNQWWSHGGAAAAQDVFITELIGTKKFKVIDRESLEEILQARNVTLSGELSAANAIKIGKLLGVNYLLTGTVTKYGVEDQGGKPTGGLNAGKRKFVVAFRTQLINTSTGKAVWSREEFGETTSVKVAVGGFGGGVDDKRKFDEVMKPTIQKAIANLKAADLKF
jgi:curli biogenesis system outer membrane secretion channel CsgG